jgi:hypothetical protein
VLFAQQFISLHADNELVGHHGAVGERSTENCNAIDGLNVLSQILPASSDLQLVSHTGFRREGKAATAAVARLHFLDDCE